MREIKFRAWMVTSPNRPYAMRFYDFTRLVEMDKAIRANPSAPIMQYTGLKDKNGKEIYERDIVEKYNSKYQVKMDDVFVSTDPGSGYIGVYGWGVFGDDDIDIGEPLDNEFEVIGNIYENPELLK